VFTDADFDFDGSHAAVSVTPKRTQDLMDAFLWETSVNFLQTSQSVRGHLGHHARNVLNLNSVNQLIFVMVKYGVLFEVRTGFLNNI
jgi:hypothetical protein